MSLHILIVEDNQAAAGLLQELLELQEHTACCAYTGQQALDAMGADDSFDIALEDPTLPDMPGMAVAQRLRASPSGAPPLLIAVSGHAPSEATRGLFNHHLQKPIDFQALDRILAQAA